jgi:hypothetical protein
MYRGLNGQMCAVGCLISDDQYDPAMEGASAVQLLQRFPSLGLSEHSSLLLALQCVHDGTPPRYWETELTRVASEFNLEVLP